MLSSRHKCCAGPVLPLSERPVQARVSQDALLAWHQSAIAHAEAIGSAFANADGGPSAEDLQVWHVLLGVFPSLLSAPRLVAPLRLEQHGVQFIFKPAS